MHHVNELQLESKSQISWLLWKSLFYTETELMNSDLKLPDLFSANMNSEGYFIVKKIMNQRSKLLWEILSLCLSHAELLHSRKRSSLQEDFISYVHTLKKLGDSISGPCSTATILPIYCEVFKRKMCDIRINWYR